MDQAAEPVVAADPIERDDVRLAFVIGIWALLGWWSLVKCPVGPVLVVVERVVGEDAFELAAAEDEQPVEAFATQGPDPALGVRPGVGCLDRRLDHADALRAKDLVEVTSELAVAVADQVPRPDVLVIKLHEQVPCLLGHPGPVRVRRDPGEMDPPRRKLDEEEDVQPFEEHGVDGEEVGLEDARRVLAEKLRPGRLQPARRGFDPGLLQDPPHGARREFDAEPDQLALDSAVPPARILVSRGEERAPGVSAAVGGRPGCRLG